MGLGNGFDGDRKMVMGVLELCSHEGWMVMVMG